MRFGPIGLSAPHLRRFEKCQFFFAYLFQNRVPFGYV